MNQKNKIYPVKQSPLYRLGRKKDLATLLNVSVGDFSTLKQKSNFKEWTNKQGRLIEEPAHTLKVLLSYLHKILQRIETPLYLMSGKAGVSSQCNATKHLETPYMINVDIEKFYQNSKREFIYSMFKDTFEQTNDIASLLADITTYDGHIPTGAPTSQILAFWAYKKTFDKIDTLSKSHDIIMTLWVDDITFSSKKPFPSNWIEDIKKILNKVDLNLKDNKTIKKTKNQFKGVTGTAISPQGEKKVKNKKRHKILKIIEEQPIEQMPEKTINSLLGQLSAQRRNEPSFFQNTYERVIKAKKKLSQKE